METKQHPAYKEAVEMIIVRFDAEGYGVVISDDDMDSYLSINKPSDRMTYDEFRAIEMDRLQRYRAMEILLIDHNICLQRSKTPPGFIILPPRDQVVIAYEKRMQKVRRELNRAAAALTNVNHTLLTMDEEQDRQKKIMRSAFIKGAINKRKIDLPKRKDFKLVENK